MPSIVNGVRFDGSVVLGLDDVRARMLMLPARLGKNVIRRALYAGAVVIRDEARRLAPVETGALRKAIVAQTRGGRQEGFLPTEIVARVSIRKPSKSQLKKSGRNPRRYAHLVEFGTQPHATGKGSRLRVTASVGGIRVAAAGPQAGAGHPGTRPRSFMRAAYDGKRLEAVRVMAAALRRELDAELMRSFKRRTA